MKILADPYDQLPGDHVLAARQPLRRPQARCGRLPAVVLGLVPLVLLRWRINVLSLGDEEAQGARRRGRAAARRRDRGRDADDRQRRRHLGRDRLGRPRHPAHRAHAGGAELRPPAAHGDADGRQLPRAGRHARPHDGRIEVPIGILTAIIGAPFFLWLLWRGRRGLVMTATPDAATHGWASATARKAGRPRCRPRGAAGEVLCLLGPNGCGQDHAVQDHARPAAGPGGEVRLGGRPIGTFAARDRAPDRLRAAGARGAVSLSALDLVLMGRTAHRGLFAGPTREDRDMAEEALDRSASPTSPSGRTRHQRRPAPARRRRPRARPGGAADRHGRADRQPRLRQPGGGALRGEATRRPGPGVVLSTHDPDHAFAIANRVILMQDGELLVHGTPAEVLTAQRLQQVYNVPVRVDRLAGGRTVCVPRYD